MAETIEELTINYEEDGIDLVKELDKAVLSKGAWTTIVFRYQQWESAKQAYSKDRYSIRRYKKIGGEYKAQSKFNISSNEQAEKLIAILREWVKN
jgi:tRNA splicing ligase